MRPCVVCAVRTYSTDRGRWVRGVGGAIGQGLEISGKKRKENPSLPSPYRPPPPPPPPVLGSGFFFFLSTAKGGGEEVGAKNHWRRRSAPVAVLCVRAVGVRSEGKVKEEE